MQFIECNDEGGDRKMASLAQEESQAVVVVEEVADLLKVLLTVEAKIGMSRMFRNKERDAIALV